MMDRWGNKIIVGWALHELEWLKAAVTLDVSERAAAYRDIAAMTLRSLDAVHDQAGKMLKAKKAEVIAPATIAMPIIPPSFINAPTKQQMMAGR